MGYYINKSKLENEHIIMEGKQHWIALLPRAVVCGFFLLSFIGTGEVTVIAFMTVITVIAMAGPLIRYYTTEIGFTNKRLIGQIGLINTQSLDSPLNKINNVSCESGLWGKLLGYGSISITTSSGAYIYKGVAKPEQFKSGLLNQISQFDSDRMKEHAQEIAKSMQSVTN